MLGAIVGDMVGSIYEFHSLKTKDFDIFNPKMRMSDDSYLTIAVAKTLIKHYPIKYEKEELHSIQNDLCKAFVEIWDKHRGAGWGKMFFRWCITAKKLNQIPEPYNSYGNGSAMRISPVGWIANNEEEVKILSKTVTEITHNHPEGIKGAEAVALCIYLALHGATKEEIKERMIKEYYPEIATLDFNKLVETYKFNSTCQKSVPQAIYCFLISNGLEDAIRNCVAIGGDSDTIGAIAGSIAESYYQKDKLSELEDKYIYLMIDPDVEKLVKEFHHTINSSKMNDKTR